MAQRTTGTERLGGADESGECGLSFGEALRYWRKKGGFSGAELAQAADLSQGNISKIERGKVLPALVTARHLLETLGLEPAVISHLLLELSHEALQRSTGEDIFIEHRGAEYQRQYLAIERVANGFVEWCSTGGMAGILTTDQYAKELIAAVEPGVHPQDIEANLDLRNQRYSNLLRRRLDARFIIHYSCFWDFCGSASAFQSQMDHLIWVARSVPHVEIRVTKPGEQLPRVPVSSWKVYDGSVVYGGTLTRQHHDTAPAVAKRTTELFEELWDTPRIFFRQVPEAVASLTAFLGTGPSS